MISCMFWTVIQGNPSIERSDKTISLLSRIFGCFPPRRRFKLDATSGSLEMYRGWYCYRWRKPFGSVENVDGGAFFDTWQVPVLHDMACCPIRYTYLGRYPSCLTYSVVYLAFHRRPRRRARRTESGSLSLLLARFPSAGAAYLVS